MKFPTGLHVVAQKWRNGSARAGARYSEVRHCATCATYFISGQVAQAQKPSRLRYLASVIAALSEVAQKWRKRVEDNLISWVMPVPDATSARRCSQSYKLFSKQHSRPCAVPKFRVGFYTEVEHTFEAPAAPTTYKKRSRSCHVLLYKLRLRSSKKWQ